MSHWEGADDFFAEAEQEMFPLLQGSKMVLCLVSGEPDAKSCIELGAAILFNKPIVIVSFGTAVVPKRLEELAEAHVHYEEDESVTHGSGADRLRAAMEQVLYSEPDRG